MPEQIDPVMWSRPDLWLVFTTHDIGALYRILKDDAGLAQRQIAALTGQTPRISRHCGSGTARSAGTARGNRGRRSASDSG